MTEVQKLIEFMTSGRRKSIVLTEYIGFQERKGTWNNKRNMRLRRELSKTDSFEISYKHICVDNEVTTTATVLTYKFQ